MKKTAATKRTPAENATDKFLGSLRQRNASPHTLKAYGSDLGVFAAYVGSRNLGEIDMRQIAPTVAELLGVRLPEAKLPPVHYQP